MLVGRSDRRRARSTGPALLLARRDPLVRRVGDEQRPVAELDLTARAPEHDLGRGDDLAGEPVLVEDLVADGELTHGRPTRGRRNRRVERKSLALEPCCQVVGDA